LQITPAQWKAFISRLNEQMTVAYSVKGAVLDNLIAIATWWTSLLWRTSHFESVRLVSQLCTTLIHPLTGQSLRTAERDLVQANKELFNPAGLNVLSPRETALQFVSSSRHVLWTQS
jgi:hypothetical protein